MRIFILIITIISAGSLRSQEQQISADEAIQKVYDILSGEEKGPVKKPSEAIMAGAWEALAYLNYTKDSLSKEDVQEAVPDYYRFREKFLILKLIDQQDYNHYGTELKVPYLVENNRVLVYDPQGKAVKDQWLIIYLDDSYLALEMGDLRLFFTRTQNQE